MEFRPNGSRIPEPPQEHFDISLSKRALAVKAGAIEITWQQTGLLILKRRGYKKFNKAQLVELATIEEMAKL